MSSNKVNIAPATAEVLRTLDWIIIVDHSGSTAEPSLRMAGKTRLDEMRESAILAARIAGNYDDDGITVIPFSTSAHVKDGVTADTMVALFQEIHPAGSTNLHLALQAAVDKAKSSPKETVVIVFTDGEANDDKAVFNVMNAAGKELGRPKIGFVFVQVGKDPGASKFLDALDNQMSVDVCATFSAEEAEELSIEQLVNAARTE